MMKQFGFVILALVLGGVIWINQSEPVPDESETINQLATLLSGEFDSFNQFQNDRINKVGKNQSHGWVNRAFVSVEAPKVADNVLVGSTRYNGPLGIVDKNEFLVWTFQAEGDGNAIIMSPRRFKDIDTRLAHFRNSEKLAGFAEEDLEAAISGAACDIIWIKTSQGFSGNSERCRVMSTTQKKMLDWNWSYQLNTNGLTISFSGTDDSGQVLDGSPSGNPYHLDRLSPGSYYRQGKKLLFNARDRDEILTSQALLEKEVEVAPENASARLMLIYAQVKRSQFQETEKHLRTIDALEGTLSEVELAWLKGLKARIADDFEAEVAAWKNLIILDPNQRWAHYELAAAYYRRELYQEASDAIESALAVESDEARWSASYLYYLHSKSLYRIGKYAESAVAAEPGLRNQNSRRATLYRKTIAQIATGKTDELNDALDQYRGWAKQDGSTNEAVLETNIALLFFEAGDYKTAIEYARTAYEQSRKPYHAWVLGYSLTENGELQEALEVLELANTEFSDEVGVLARLGWAYYRSGDFEQAYKHLKAAQKLTTRWNSGVERDLAIVEAAINNPSAKQVPPVRWYGS